jgi:hypothetical protein
MIRLRKPKAKQHANLTTAHRFAPKQEKKLSKRLSGRVTKGSGNGIEKGDVRVKGLKRIECKCTRHESFTVSREMVAKIEAAALASGELPYIEICFLQKDTGRVVSRVAVVPAYVMEATIWNESAP